VNTLRQAEVLFETAEILFWSGKLGDLRELAPGDFAVVKRRLRLIDKPIEAQTLFDEIIKECAMKPKTSKQARFLAKACEINEMK
jgi:hypothetical protein